MKRSTTVLLLLAALLLVFGAASVLLEFRVQEAEMTTDSESSAYSFSVGENKSLPLEQDLDLYVQAPQRLRERLAGALSDALSANPYVRDVNLMDGDPAPAADTVLIVELEEGAVFAWTPFYTRSVFTAHVYYASDGEVAWIDQEVVELDSGAAPEDMVVRVEAEHSCNGHAYGLISGPGYADYLATDLATLINDSLVSSLETQVQG